MNHSTLVRGPIVGLVRICGLLVLFVAQGLVANPSGVIWRLRYLDSLTGIEVVPDRVEGSSGVQSGSLAEGLHSLRVRARGYEDVEMTQVVPGGQPNGEFRLHLDPLVTPTRLTRESVRERTSSDRMLVHGFVVGDESGLPLSGAKVVLESSTLTASVGADGYFELLVPVTARPGDAERRTLTFSNAGRITRRMAGVEFWRGGDWLLRIRLTPGEGIELTEDPNRRLAIEMPTVDRDPGNGVSHPDDALRRALPAADPGVPVRVPRRIRVRTANGVDSVSLETYVKRVLPAEWIPSWGSLNQNRGMHSLRAGAVAIRTYGVGFVHVPQSAEADICATTSCQVYDPSRQSSLTDLGTDDTAGNVMVDGSGWVGFKITEYSAENNGLGTTCGDGFIGNIGTCRADPVCGGLNLARNGHGRGLCQAGSARWATGWSRVLSNPGTPHAFGTKTWQGILAHYYPTLTLKSGTPLTVNDGVEIWAAGGGTVASRACEAGTIGQGTSCTALARLSNGEKGLIIDGPQQIVADGNGYTWWKVRWPARGIVGWTAENFLQRAEIPLPECPCELALTIPERVSDSSWNLEVKGTIGVPYILEQSADLRQWTTIASGRIPAAGSLLIRVEPGDPLTSRYFRARR
jgi:hypothetical protein